MKVEETEESACEFEHMLAEHVTESICTLLGHPASAPRHAHPGGALLPRGPQGGREPRGSPHQVERRRAGPGRLSEFVVALPAAQAHGFRIAPGMKVRVHQHYPTTVVECERTQLAMEEEIARDIHVWREKEAEKP